MTAGAMADQSGTRSPAIDDRVRVDVHPGGVPALVWPRDEKLARDTDAFIEWFSSNKNNLDRLAAVHGALILRGFPLRSTDDFGRAISHYPTNDMTYVGGAAPRNQLAERVYESTQALKQWDLMLHQEMAYLPRFPRMVAFFSRVSAWAGGETILANFRELTDRIPRRFWDEVRDRGVRYERNFRAPGEVEPEVALFHKSWTTTFGTEDAQEAEAACRSVGLDPRWRDDGSLSTLYHAPGFIEHPFTGETVWFNHIASQTMNRRMIGDYWDVFLAHYGTDRVRPYQTTFGDGGPIDLSDVEELYTIFESLAQSFRWHDGDLMVIDNIMTAHGRNPYEGERDLQVALLG